MHSIEYFEKHKLKILETAKFLCEKDSSCSVDNKFEELKLQYYNNEGSHHSETIKTNDLELNINELLENIRHDTAENFVVCAFYNNSLHPIYKNVGNQFSNNNINLNDIDKAIVNLLIFNGIKSIGIYVLHNHPFIYKASPSEADLKTLEVIIEEINNIEKEARAIGKECQICLVDFSIVTEFDYWSTMQTYTTH